MSSRGKVLTTDGRVVDVTDKEWQYERWWSKKSINSDSAFDSHAAPAGTLWRQQNSSLILVG
jgi:hypothetical protein